jgi:uncharacterized protein YggE
MLLLLSVTAQINGIGSENTQTTSVNIYPNTQDNTIIGYRYSYDLTVTVKNLTSSLLSEVLDTATAVGGNALQINDVSVGVAQIADNYGALCIHFNNSRLTMYLL